MKNEIAANLAKINQPVAESTLLRKQLFLKLDKARERSFVCVSAPAGSGKTTLVSSYMQDKNIPCLWYQIDSGDKDLATFFYYLGLAGKNVAPKSGNDFPVFRPEHSLGIPEFSREFFSEIYSCLPPVSTIVFDDFQEVGDHAPLHAALLAALDRIPKGITILFLSRSGPPALFSRLLANRQATLFRWEDLRFSLEEFRSVVSLWQGKANMDESLEEMYTVMDGWIAGLHLITELGDSKNMPRISTDSPQEIFDYFSFEAFSKFDAPLQDFLVKTSFISPVSVRMAKMISGNSSAETFLHNLHRDNYFTNKKSPPEVVYHYHPLFKDFLLQQASKRLTVDEIKAVRYKAADLLLEAQRYEEAVECLRQTNDWQRLVAIILQYAPDLIVQGRNLTLLKWLGYVPEETAQQEPWLLFWLGISKLNFSPEESRKILEQVLAEFENRNDMPGMLKSWACLVDSISYEWNDFARLDKWIDKMTEMSAQGLVFPSTSLEADVAGAMLSACYFRQSDHPDKPYWEMRTIELFSQVEDINQKINLGSKLLFNGIFKGDFAKVSEMLRDWSGFVAGNKKISPLTRLRWFYFKSLYEWMAGQLSACEETVAQVLQFADECGVHFMDNYIAAQGIYAGLGMADLKMIQRYSEKIQTPNRPLGANEKVVALNIESYQALFQGEQVIALNAAKQSTFLAGESGFPFTEALAKISYGQLLTETGDFDEGGRVLHQALAAGEKMGSNYVKFGGLLYSAYHAFETKNDTGGFDFLSRALLLGKNEGYYNFHWFHPFVVGGLFVKALMAGIEVEYVQCFIRKRKIIPKTSPLEVENWPWSLRIYTLGRFELVVNGKLLRFSGRTKQRPLDLLKALISLGGSSVSEDKINEALWPDADGDLQHQTFATTLHRLRKLLGIKKALVLNNSKLTLDDRYCWVDTWAFEKLLERAENAWQKNGDQASAVLYTGKAAELYKGHFLDSSQDYWSVFPQKQYHSHYLSAMEKLGEFHEKSGCPADAIHVYQTALEVDPLVEELYQRLMLCYQRAGEPSEAVATYRRCSEVLSRVLQAEPSTETQEIYRDVSS